MGRKTFYKPGSWYLVDDRTGFPTRAERMKKQWDGLMVDRERWEARQPQDFVRGVRDRQSVPVARPVAPKTFVGPSYMQLTENVGAIGYLLTLDTVSGLGPGSIIKVMLDTGGLFQTEIYEITGDQVLVIKPLPTPASAGNVVIATGVVAPLTAAILGTEDGRILTTEDGVPIASNAIIE